MLSLKTDQYLINFFPFVFPHARILSFYFIYFLFSPSFSATPWLQIIPSSRSTPPSFITPFLLHFNPSLSFPSSHNHPRLSGDLAEAKCFFLFRCRWGCNKACQWEAWVALSHALCAPSVNSLQPPPLIPANPLTHHSLPCFYFSSLICMPFRPHFALLLPETVLFDMSLLSLVSLPTALSGTRWRRTATGDTTINTHTHAIHVNDCRWGCIVCPAAAANQPLLFLSKPAGCMEISFLYTKQFSVAPCLFVLAHRVCACMFMCMCAHYTRRASKG